MTVPAGTLWLIRTASVIWKPIVRRSRHALRGLQIRAMFAGLMLQRSKNGDVLTCVSVLVFVVSCGAEERA